VALAVMVRSQVDGSSHGILVLSAMVGIGRTVRRIDKYLPSDCFLTKRWFAVGRIGRSQRSLSHSA